MKRRVPVPTACAQCGGPINRPSVGKKPVVFCWDCRRERQRTANKLSESRYRDQTRPRCPTCQRRTAPEVLERAAREAAASAETAA